MAKAIVTKKKMAQRRKRFTVAMIRNLEPEAKPYPVYDSHLAGLRVMVYPTGSKVFQVYGKPRGSQRPVNCRICKEGQLPLNSSDPKTRSVYSEARELIAQLAQGLDPNKKKQQQIEAAKVEAAQQEAGNITLQEALDQYLENVTLADNTVSGYRAVIKNHLSDWLELPLVSINAKMIKAQHKEIGEKHPVAANNTMRVFRAVYNWVSEELEDELDEPLPPAPTGKLKKRWNAERPRKNTIQPEQLEDWWAATLKITGEGAYLGDGQLAADYLQFVLMTGCRRREASDLQWAQVNLKAKTFTITSSAAKNNIEVTLPLCDFLVQILKRRKEDGSKRPFPLVEVRRFVRKVEEWSEVQFSVHDLRRTFITWANDMDISQYTVKALVNHSRGNDVTAGYDQVGMTRLRKASSKICDYILSRAGQREAVVSISEARSNG